MEEKRISGRVFHWVFASRVDLGIWRSTVSILLLHVFTNFYAINVDSSQFAGVGWSIGLLNGRRVGWLVGWLSWWLLGWYGRLVDWTDSVD